jgi:hypothetical protein
MVTDHKIHYVFVTFPVAKHAHGPGWREDYQPEFEGAVIVAQQNF